MSDKREAEMTQEGKMPAAKQVESVDAGVDAVDSTVGAVDTATREEKIQQIENYREQSTLLIHNIKQLQHLNNKLNNDLVYIQDYVSKLIKQ